MSQIEAFLEAHKKLVGRKFKEFNDSYNDKLLIYAYCLWSDGANLNVCANIHDSKHLSEEFITEQLKNTFMFTDETIIGE